MQCRISDITDTDPSSPDEVIAELTPILALVAPAGMDTESRRVWFHAAVRALDGIPIALLKRGAAEAMRLADHPSKIVPTITKAVRDDWEWRRQYRGRPSAITADTMPRRVPDGERKEVAELMGDLINRLGRDSDGSPKGGDGEAGSVHDSAGRQASPESARP